MGKNNKSKATNSKNKGEVQPPEMPENFKSVIIDFLNDLSTTFPDYKHLWEKWTSPELPQIELQYLFEYLMHIYPERFFDILYQNEEIFSDSSEINTHFLPDVDFKLLYNCSNISKTIQKSIWKYLQLILFTIINTIKDKSKFGDTKDIFEGINEDELQTKLSETILSITDFFTNINESIPQPSEENNTYSTPPPPQSEENNDNNSSSTSQPDFSDFTNTAKTMFENMSGGKMPNFENMKNNLPKPEELHEHLKGLFDGKIGKLAKELAEEISGDFSELLDKDDNSIKTTQDVLNKLMKNPGKMMDLMKTVSNKITKKMKDGDLSQDEIMKEAGDLIGKMKDMGGMEQFNEMFKNLKQQMGGGMGKNMKMDTNAITRLSKQQALKQRLKERLDAKRQLEAATTLLSLTNSTTASISNPVVSNISNPVVSNISNPVVSNISNPVVSNISNPVVSNISNYSIEPSVTNPDIFTFKMGSSVQDKSIRTEIKQKMDNEIDKILLDVNSISTKKKNKKTNKFNKINAIDK